MKENARDLNIYIAVESCVLTKRERGGGKKKKKPKKKDCHDSFILLRHLVQM